MGKKNLMVLKIFEKVTQTFMQYLKEINQRRNVMEQKLYDSSRNEELLELDEDPEKPGVFRDSAEIERDADDESIEDKLSHPE